MYKIVVHPGNAHRDDFMAVSVLLASLAPAEVFRREPTGEDLADADTFVVDVGMAYDPSRHNFDHHQDLSLPCAFHLVMKHLGYHEDALEVFGWYPILNMIDVRGPHKTAEQLGIDASVIFASSSPIDGYILSRFSKVKSLGRHDLLFEFMKELGQDLLALIGLKKQRLELLKKEGRVYAVKQYKALVSPVVDNPKLAMELYLRFLNDRRIVMCITPSVRGAGWELLRLGQSTIVDFRALRGSPEVQFVHANGYVATTRTLMPQAEVIELAARALSDAR